MAEEEEVDTSWLCAPIIPLPVYEELEKQARTFIRFMALSDAYPMEYSAAGIIAHWLQVCCQLGVRIDIAGEAALYTVDPWVKRSLGPSFYAAMRSYMEIIRKVCATERVCRETPESARKKIRKIGNMTRVERDAFLQDCVRIGIIRRFNEPFVPGDLDPVLYESIEDSQRREAEYVLHHGIELAVRIDEENRAGIKVEFDPSPAVSWIKTTYPNGKVSVYYFVNLSYLGKGDSCTCKWKQYHPKDDCKHEKRRALEFARRALESRTDEQ